MTGVERVLALRAILCDPKYPIPLELNRIGKGLTELIHTESASRLAHALASVRGMVTEIQSGVIAFGSLISVVTSSPGPVGPEFELPGTEEEWSAVFTWVESNGDVVRNLPTLVLIADDSCDDLMFQDWTGITKLSSRISDIGELLQHLPPLDSPPTFEQLLDGLPIDPVRADRAAEYYGDFENCGGDLMLAGLLSSLSGVYQFSLGFEGGFPGMSDDATFFVAEERSMTDLQTSFRRLAANVQAALRSVEEAAAKAAEESEDAGEE